MERKDVQRDEAKKAGNWRQRLWIPKGEPNKWMNEVQRKRQREAEGKVE